MSSTSHHLRYLLPVDFVVHVQRETVKEVDGLWQHIGGQQRLHVLHQVVTTVVVAGLHGQTDRTVLAGIIHRQGHHGSLVVEELPRHALYFAQLDAETLNLDLRILPPIVGNVAVSIYGADVARAVISFAVEQKEGLAVFLLVMPVAGRQCGPAKQSSPRSPVPTTLQSTSTINVSTSFMGRPMLMMPFTALHSSSRS